MHSSNPESKMASISPYIATSGKLMAKMVVGADPCVCPDLAACASQPFDNTNGSKLNLRHKKASGVRLKCAT